jgi:hypothetical protein
MRYRSPESIQVVDGVLASIVGDVCWAVSAGGCVGSRFILDCGKKIPRDIPLTNPNASEELRHFAGSTVISVGNAPWKLSDATSVITSWEDSCEPDGPIVQGLCELIGERITSAHIDQPGFDLELRFGSDYLLKVICAGLGDDSDNYSIVANGRRLTAELVRVDDKR